MIRIVLTLFFLGAIFGTLGDLTHVLSGTLGYPDPLLPLPFGQPIWVPFLFGAATVAIGLSLPWSDTWLRTKKSRPRPQTPAGVISGMVVFLVIYGMSGFLPLHPTGIRDLILGAAAIGAWYFYDRTGPGVLQGLLVAFCGSAVEASLCSQGVFYYNPNIITGLPVPTWLPWIYFAAAAVVGNLGRALMKKKKR